MRQKVMAQPVQILQPLVTRETNALMRKVLDPVSSNVATSAAKEDPTVQMQRMRAMQGDTPTKGEAGLGGNRSGLGMGRSNGATGGQQPVP